MTDVTGEEFNIPMLTKSFDIVEELGYVETVFSDKTGTLTCNRMDFRKCSIGGVSYGLGTTEIGAAYRTRLGLPPVPTPVADPSEPNTPHVGFIDPLMRPALNGDHGAETQKRCEEFYISLALNHDVIPEKHGGAIVFSASNPDDEAFVYAARHFGFDFTAREPKALTCQTPSGAVRVEILQTLSFSSERKRSSIIVRYPDGRIVLYSKGADNVIKKRLGAGTGADLLAKTEAHLDEFVNDGLRTLLVAKVEITGERYASWAKRYKEAEASLEDREEKMDAMLEEVESDMILLGSTAIEDKLQDGVGDTIASLRAASIKVWMLTGDKVDTAINIAFSCALLTLEMTVVRVVSEDPSMDLDEHKLPTQSSVLDAIHAAIAEAKRARERGDPVAAVVDTGSFSSIVAFGLEAEFVELADLCKSLVCARVSPKQKAAIVRIVQVASPDTITLSVGDGANDVPMIQTAHVGVGIFGLEGKQAVNSSDFAIGQFRFLKKLLLVHGRWNYRRNAMVTSVLYYKNAVLVLPQYFFGGYSLFSGQNYYYDGFYQTYNAIYTALPIVALAVLDQDVTAETVCANPGLYRDGIEHVHNTHLGFWSFMLESAAQGVVVTWVPLWGMGWMNVAGDGQVMGLWDLGQITITLVVFCVTVKVATLTKMWTGANWFILLGSIVLWFLSWRWFDGEFSPIPSDYIPPYLDGNYERTVYGGLFWLIVLLSTVVCFLPMFVRESYYAMVAPMRSTIGRELEKGYRAEQYSFSPKPAAERSGAELGLALQQQSSTQMQSMVAGGGA